MKARVITAACMAATTYINLPDADLSRVQQLMVLGALFGLSMALIWWAEELPEQIRESRYRAKRRRKNIDFTVGGSGR